MVPALPLFSSERFPVSRSKQKHFKFKPVYNSLYSKDNNAMHLSANIFESGPMPTP